MLLPRNAATPAGETGAEHSDSHSKADLSISPDDDISTHVERAIIGCLLSDLAPFVVAQHLDLLTADLFTDTVCRFVFEAIEATATAGHPATPLLVVEGARRAQLEVPPALGEHVVSELCRMQSTAPAVACLPHLVEVLREHSARRSVVRLGSRLVEAAWIGDLDRLAELVQLETGRVLDELAAVGA